MNRGHGLRWVLLVTALSLVVTPAFAGKALPAAGAVAEATRTLILGTPMGAKAVCALGITDSPVWSVGYIYPDQDQYFTLIDPSECVEGAECGVAVSIAHIALEFSYAMDTPVRVGIVEADLTDAQCPVPVPGSYVCAPVEYDLVGPGSGIFDLALPLSTNCPLTGPAFLEITFTTWGPYWEVPNLVLTGSCESCRSYNYYPGDNYDLCTFGFDGNPIMYVEAECANPVSVESNTWGEMKAQYR